MSSKLDQKPSVGYAVSVTGSVPETVEKLTVELKNRGFGVLSNIDVKKILKEKLGENIEDYVILDVCNPKQAKTALDSHKEVGLALPCKITVYEDRARTWVSLYRPTAAIGALGFEDLRQLAEKVESDLRSAIDSIAK